MFVLYCVNLEQLYLKDMLAFVVYFCCHFFLTMYYWGHGKLGRCVIQLSKFLNHTLATHNQAKVNLSVFLKISIIMTVKVHLH
jgi:hypothetical protein